MLEVEKGSLIFGLFGFLKSAFFGTREVLSWLDRVRGKMTVGVKMMDADIVLIQLGWNKKVAEVMGCAEDFSLSSFTVLEKGK